MVSRQLRAAISEEEHYQLRLLAIRLRQPIQQMVADALRRDRVTRQAFQAKEDTK